MTSRRELKLSDELRRFIDDSSIPDSGRPRFVLIMGGIGSGKSTMRRERYATGAVLIDAAEILANIRPEDSALFPGVARTESRLWTVGRLLSRLAIAERRHIVTEIVGAEPNRVEALIDTMKAISYEVHVEFVYCDPTEAYRRHLAQPPLAVSSFYSEHYHHSWLHAEASKATGGHSQVIPIASSPASPSAGQQDCLDGINALELRINQMRLKKDDHQIPEHMAARTLEAFVALDKAGEPPASVALAAADLFYRRIAVLDQHDRFTTAYISTAVRECFRQLALRELPIYYVLDNALREDRFRSVCLLFDAAGVAVTSPAIHGTDWPTLDGRIGSTLDLGLHAAYVEPDAAVDHLDAARSLASRFACTATFRKHDPGQATFTALRAR